MITYNEFLNIKSGEIEQGSEDWHKLRLGVISASRIYDAISVGRNGKYKASRNRYLYELVSEMLTGQSKSINGKSLAWGNEHEPEARSLIELDRMEVIKEVGFIYKDHELRCGASPDGIINNCEGVEIKCPYDTNVHLSFLLDEEVKEMYRFQCQFSLWVTGFDVWHFYSLDPRIKDKDISLIGKTYKKDFELFRTFDREVPIFLSELDRLLEKVGVKFGDQWK